MSTYHAPVSKASGKNTHAVRTTRFCGHSSINLIAPVTRPKPPKDNRRRSDSSLMYEEISGARGEVSIRKGSLGVISTCPIQTTELNSGPTVQKPAADDPPHPCNVNADLRSYATPFVCSLFDLQVFGGLHEARRGRSCPPD